MTNDKNKNLCLELLKAESEDEIISILKEYNYWDKKESWVNFGDNESNFSVIGAQQKYPEKALVEKIVNSVDAVLMRECLVQKINPESEEAPQSIEEALEQFFKIKYGKLSALSAQQRTELAENIALVATGEKTLPNYLIIDKGEGQTPKKLPLTILSLLKSNKLRILFVQGRFNMGGTGALRFCGENNFQLVISRRHPEIIEYEGDDGTSEFWGFTIVRRIRPTKGMRNSVYKYLSPNNEILKFKSDNLPILPGEESSYGKSLDSGTLIKLYEYEMVGSLRTNILFDLYNRLSLLMPAIALPIRLYERRGYLGHSLETTLSGLNVRLDEDKHGNLESGFPSSESVIIEGQKIHLQIYAFKKGEDGKSRKIKYARNDGIVFVVDRLANGFYNKQFFSRKKVGMGYLENYILVTVDCSELNETTREDLFMNTRDRLSDCEFKNLIEKELQQIIKNHQGLRELKEKRKREFLEKRIQDDEHLAFLLEDVIKKSPTLSKLFIKGEKITTPFNLSGVGTNDTFEGKQFPTYFELMKKFPRDKPKSYFLGKRIRIQFVTDAENNYFAREDYPGEFFLYFNDFELKLNYANINLWNGIATLNMEIPARFQIGELIEVTLKVSDPSKITPFAVSFYLKVKELRKTEVGKTGKRKKPADPETEDDRKAPLGLELPKITEIKKENWEDYDFHDESVLKIIYDDLEGYNFFINVHNKYLLSEIKGKLIEKQDPEILTAQFKYGMVLIALSILRINEEKEVEEDVSIYEEIFKLCECIAPVLIPMISSLAELEIIE